MANGDTCGSDCMEIGTFKLVGFRTFFIAMILIVAYVVLLSMDRPLGGLEGMVSFVLGFMFGNKGAAIASDAYAKIAKAV